MHTKPIPIILAGLHMRREHRRSHMHLFPQIHQPLSLSIPTPSSKRSPINKTIIININSLSFLNFIHTILYQFLHPFHLILSRVYWIRCTPWIYCFTLTL